MFWTDDKTERLKRLWAGGLIVSDICAALGVTRGAVAGKAKRLGLPKRNNAALRGNRKPRNVSRRASMRIKRPVEQYFRPFCEPVSVLEFKPGICRFAVGPHLQFQKGFCGAKALPGKSYCGFHHQICYPPRVKRDLTRALTDYRVKKFHREAA